MAIPTVRSPEPLPRGAHDVGPVAPQSAPPGWLRRAAQLGLVVRGLVYFVPGALAVAWAFGHHGPPVSPAGVITLVARQPFGRLVLLALAAGFLGYSAWGVVRAITATPFRRGSAMDLAWRAGDVASAVAYFGLLLATLRAAAGGAQPAVPTRDWTWSVMARPFGGVVVALIGLAWLVGSGLSQIIVGWRRTFEWDFRLGAMPDRDRRLLETLGRVGVVARGVVFTVTGLLVIGAALRLRAGAGARTGLDGALVEIALQPLGRLLVVVAGAGLMVFGTYSAMGARWMRLRRAPAAPESTTPPG